MNKLNSFITEKCIYSIFPIQLNIPVIKINLNTKFEVNLYLKVLDI